MLTLIIFWRVFISNGECHIDNGQICLYQTGISLGTVLVTETILYLSFIENSSILTLSSNGTISRGIHHYFRWLDAIIIWEFDSNRRVGSVLRRACLNLLFVIFSIIIWMVVHLSGLFASLVAVKLQFIV